jgi:alpha-glucosidase
MQWSAAPHAGFSSATPWLPLASDYQQVNVERQQADPHSMLSLYRALLALRRAEPALAIGAYTPLEVAPPLLGYLRTHGDRRFGVLLNTSARELRAAVPAALRSQTIVLSTHAGRAGGALGSDLSADEGVVFTR